MPVLYDRDGITLIGGDALAELPRIAVGSVGLVLTDPPYNVSARNGRSNTTIGKVRRRDGSHRAIRRDFGGWDHGWAPAPFFAAVRPLIRPGGALIAFTSEYLMADYLASGLDHRALLYWRKANPAPNFRQQVVRAVEMAVWQTAGSPWTFGGSGYEPNIWEAPLVAPSERVHPTQKPVALLERWLQLFSRPDDLILDPFCGSGSTLVAALRNGQRAIGIEIDPVYAEAARRRLALPLFEQEVSA